MSPKELFLTYHKIRKEKFKDHTPQKTITEQDKAYLKAISNNFNTVWHNINLNDFIRCGFSIFKENFTFEKFFERKVIDLYIRKDKQNKWYSRMSIKESFEKSMNFVRKYMKENHITSLYEYCGSVIGGRKIVIDHHVKDNKVCKYFIVYMYQLGFLKMNDADWLLLPHVRENYVDISNKLSILNGSKK